MMKSDEFRIKNDKKSMNSAFKNVKFCLIRGFWMCFSESGATRWTRSGRLCIQFCDLNDGLCIQMMNFVFKMMNFSFTWWILYYKWLILHYNDGFCIRIYYYKWLILHYNDGFCIKMMHIVFKMADMPRSASVHGQTSTGAGDFVLKWWTY